MALAGRQADRRGQLRRCGRRAGERGAAGHLESFDPAALGGKPERPPPLKKLLVTGDSLAQPLDLDLARRLAGDGVRVERDP
ncbi:MAG: hypothetical protein ACREX8_03390, partial [Gammaproteobacteria bacterium]